MTLQELVEPKKITQVFPEEKEMPLEGLYLDQGLAGISARIGRSLVIANFLTDKNGVVAKSDGQGKFQVPLEIKNASDWRLFQELMAQADVIISGGAYLKRLSAPGSHAEDILYQFDPGGAFEKLGEWRLNAGYASRSPDVAIVARSLDFTVPAALLRSGRRILIFTSYSLAGSEQARALTRQGMVVVGSGEAGVEGDRMIDYLNNGWGYRVIMMATGPSVLELLLEAKRLDLLYITEAQVEIPFDDPSTVKTVLPKGRKPQELKEFGVTHRYLQEDVVTENGAHISQLFLRYDSEQGEPMQELAQLHCSPITADTPRLGEKEIGQLKTTLSGWKTHTKKGELRLEKSFPFKDFKQALAFTERIGELANEEDHHPAILTEWGKVTVSWWTHKIKGLHKNDFIMAAKTERAFGTAS